MIGFESILPFLRPIAHLLQDPDVTEIMINGSRRVFVERHGVELEERQLTVAVRNIVRALGDDVSCEKPILDSRLPDGSRVSAVIPSCSVGGTTVTIRKFQARWFTPTELVRNCTVTPEALDLVREAVRRNQSILISGGTGTDKTTFLSALPTYFSPRDRVVLIEETAEVHVELPNVVRFEARREQGSLPPERSGTCSAPRSRHRPDRIVVGEIRGGEAFELLQALNTGHAGCLSTIHANSPEDALTRLTACLLQSGVEVSNAVVRRQIADAIRLVLHLGRRHESAKTMRSAISRVGRQIRVKWWRRRESKLNWLVFLTC